MMKLRVVKTTVKSRTTQISAETTTEIIRIKEDEEMAITIVVVEAEAMDKVTAVEARVVKAIRIIRVVAGGAATGSEGTGMRTHHRSTTRRRRRVGRSASSRPPTRPRLQQRIRTIIIVIITMVVRTKVAGEVVAAGSASNRIGATTVNPKIPASSSHPLSTTEINASFMRIRGQRRAASMDEVAAEAVEAEVNVEAIVITTRVMKMTQGNLPEEVAEATEGKMRSTRRARLVTAMTVSEEAADEVVAAEEAGETTTETGAAPAPETKKAKDSRGEAEAAEAVAIISKARRMAAGISSSSAR